MPLPGAIDGEPHLQAPHLHPAGALRRRTASSMVLVGHHGVRLLTHGSRASGHFLRVHGGRFAIRDMRAVEATEHERPALLSCGVDNLTVQRYLIWRRSWLLVLILPALINALFHVIASLRHDVALLNPMGETVHLVVGIVHTVALPVAAVLAAWTWTDHRRSRRILAAGGAVAYLLPLGVALLPIAWFLRDAPAGDVLHAEPQIAGLFAGIGYFVTLLPIVTSLIPGVLRACTRIKSLLPESIVPGWFLVLSAPLYALILLLVFILVNQVAGNGLLIMAMLLLMGAPVLYLVKTPLFIRPIASVEDRRSLDRLQLVYGLVVMAGVSLLLAYLLTIEFFGHRVVGDVNRGALMSDQRMAWELSKFAVSFLARSMFVTAMAVDLFMLVNLSVWRNTKAFQGSPGVAAYDLLMAQFGAVAERRSRPAVESAGPRS